MTTTVEMTSRERIKAAAAGQAVDKTPIWLMRQAGRYLPEYRALKEKYSFVEMVKTPDLATEVTLQPLKRFDFDAAIIFSDILVIPEALGQPYHFRDGGGIGMDYVLDSEDKINKLDPQGIREKLDYVPQALKQTRQAMGDTKALLGFAGAPWTLATYMVEGGSSKNFEQIKHLAYGNKPLFERLMEKLTGAIIEYYQMQIEAGVDAVQIFDSWGGICAGEDYWEMSLKWIKRIIDSVQSKVPVILFAKGTGQHFALLQKTNASVISLDWTMRMADYKDKSALQGNMDPVLLNMDKAIVKQTAEHILTEMKGAKGHIFNLGHGILPQAKIENVELLVDTVHNFKG